MKKGIRNLILKQLLNEEQYKLISSYKKLKSFGFEQLNNFTEDDVFIIGYPKSGNTLLQSLIAHLVFGVRIDAPISLINNCVTEYYNNPFYFRNNNRHFFKSHELPKPEYKKVIYIVRDGRDAIRSYYYMMKNMGKECSIKKLYENGGEIFVGNWVNHVKKWTTNEFNANILYIRYEDLITNKKSIIIEICNFLNIDRNDQEIDQVIEATSLENMKKMEKSYGWDKIKTIQDWKEGGNFVREGSQKGYLIDIDIEKNTIDKFNNLSVEMLKKYGY